MYSPAVAGLPIPSIYSSPPTTGTQYSFLYINLIMLDAPHLYVGQYVGYIAEDVSTF